MTYYAEAKLNIAIWKRSGLKPMESYFALSGQIKYGATWDQVADLIVGYLMGQEPQQEFKKAA